MVFHLSLMFIILFQVTSLSSTECYSFNGNDIVTAYFIRFIYCSLKTLWEVCIK